MQGRCPAIASEKRPESTMCQLKQNEAALKEAFGLGYKLDGFDVSQLHGING